MSKKKKLKKQKENTNSTTGVFSNSDELIQSFLAYAKSHNDDDDEASFSFMIEK